MKKEIRKMYGWAILKIVFAILLLVAVVVVLVYERDELETVLVVTVGVCWGIVIIIYLTAGILTIKNGSKEAKEYIRHYPQGEDVLEAEYQAAEDFGRIKIGKLHVFANASDDFYIIPYTDIEDVYVRNHGRNSAKLRNGYYYLYIKTRRKDSPVKVYYAYERSANEAFEQLYHMFKVKRGI